MKSVIEVAKKTVCPKSKFPFGLGRDSYSPSCVIDVHPCKDVCGKRCTGRCKEQHSQCSRGHLHPDFLFCPSSTDEVVHSTLPYITYEVIEETNVKEGKKPYKRLVVIYIKHRLKKLF